MGQPHAIPELVRQHRLLVADLIAADNHVSNLREQIRAVETVLRLLGFEGEMPAYPVRRPTFPIFARGEISKALRDLYRDKPDLKLPQQLAREIIRVKGWDGDNMMLLGRVARAVKDHRKRHGKG